MEWLIVLLIIVVYISMGLTVGRLIFNKKVIPVFEAKLKQLNNSPYLEGVYKSTFRVNTAEEAAYAFVLKEEYEAIFNAKMLGIFWFVGMFYFVYLYVKDWNSFSILPKNKAQKMIATKHAEIARLQKQKDMLAEMKELKVDPEIIKIIEEAL